MAKEEQIIIKEATLTNNCPECFNQNLKLTFFQKHLVGKFYNRTTGEISQEIRCTTCGSLIFPVKWTDDIERSFEYFQKTVTPEPASIKLSPLFYIVLVGILAVAGLLTYLYSTGIIAV